MAIYKPSNFYPNLDEIDMTDVNGNIFECQVNTDGVPVKAYQLNIFSEDGVLLYNYAEDFEFDVKNKDFAEIPIGLYELPENTTISDTKTISLSNKFFYLTKNLTYENRQNNCPYCLFNILEENINNFFIGSYDKTKKQMTILDIKSFKYTSTGFEIEVSDNATGTLYVGLKNGFNYKWTVRLYENKISTISSIDNQTFVNSGYLTGTNQGVILYNKENINFKNVDNPNNDLDNNELIDKYVKYNNYIEVDCTLENSFIFKDQNRKGYVLNGNLTWDNTNGLIFVTTDTSKSFVDCGDYLSSMYANITITSNQMEKINTNTHLYPYISLFKNGDNYEYSEKVVNFNLDTGIIKFNNKQLIDIIKTINEPLPCGLHYKKREKIYNVSNNLGFNNNINEILMDKDFKEYVKNNENYHLFECDNVHTASSVFVTPNGEIQVGRYIRFPTIDGLQYNTTNFNTGKGLGNFVESGNFDDTTKSKTGLYKNNHDFILYKIIGYDDDSGEVRLENSVYRKLTDTDIYEIWLREEESGETTKEYFTRKLPMSSKETEYKKVGGELVADIPCCNSNHGDVNSTIYMQPNINMKSDEFYNPQLIFKNNNKVNLSFIYDANETRNLNKRDKTIDKLDNSQWIITTKENEFPIECGSEYSIYSGFIDSSPESYFYARDIGTLTVRYTQIDKYDEDKIKDYPEIGDDKLLDYNLIRFINCLFVGDYKSNIPLKRYRYVIKQNDDIIVDTGDIYDNEIVCQLNGLGNGLIYNLSLEVEDQYGYIYHYEKEFKVQYTVYLMTNSNINFSIKQSINGNGLMFYTNNSISDFRQYSNNILVYKKRKGQGYEYVTNLFVDETNLVEIDEGYFVLGAIDYNVVNDTWYDYLFILKGEDGNKDTEHEYWYKMYYTAVSASYKACFKSWALSDLILQSDNTYQIGDIWEFKYNLSSSELTVNTSVTKWDTLGKYSQVSIGERNYMSSSLSCLIGDVGEYKRYENDNKIKIKDGYNEYGNDVSSNNADKMNDWKKFCVNSNKKLLQDFKGNRWIVHILENPTIKIDDNTFEQMATLSFNWTEIESANNLIIVNSLTPYKKKTTDSEALFEKLRNEWDYFEQSDNIILLSDYKATSPADVFLPYIEGYSYNLITYNTQGPFNKFNNNIISFTVDVGMDFSVRKKDGDTYINDCWDYLFYNCENLTTINNVIPSSKVNSFNHTFDGCKNLHFSMPITTALDCSVTDICKGVGTNSQFIFNINTIGYNSSQRLQNFNCKLYSELDYNYRNNTNIVIESPIKFNIDDYTIEEDKTNNMIILDNYIGTETTVIFPERITYNGTIYSNIQVKDTTYDNKPISNILISSSVKPSASEDNYHIHFNILKNCLMEYGCIYVNQNNSNYLLVDGITDVQENYKYQMLYSKSKEILCKVFPYMTYTDIYSIKMLNDVDSIMDKAFYGCYFEDNSLQLSDNLSSIQSNVLEGTNLQIIRIPETIENINSNAFKNSDLRIIAIDKEKDSISGSPWGAEYPNIVVYWRNTYSESTENIKIYSVYDTLYVKGTGVLPVLSSTPSWKEDTIKSQLKHLIVLDGITNIESNYFDTMNFEDIILANTITEIKSHAFNYCENLNNVILSNTLETIGNFAFSNCSILRSIMIPNSVTNIADGVFRGCSSLTSINIPNSVTHIGAFAFSNCTSLDSINIPNSVTSIGDYAFQNCTSLRSINIPDSVTSIKQGAFYNCTSLTSINIPDSVTSIGASAFSGCTLLASINIPNSVTHIGDFAFSSCTLLASINIPNSVTSIGWYAFQNCTSLTSFYIPNSVTSIGDYAFEGCTKLEKIIINREEKDGPSGSPWGADTTITTIYWKVVYDTSDENINLWSLYDTLHIDGIGTTLTYYNYDKTLTNLDISDSLAVTLTKIGDSVFQKTNFKNFNEQINKLINLKEIGNRTFSHSNINTIPNTITVIGDAAFAFCNNLVNINISNLKVISSYAFNYCENLKTIVLSTNLQEIQSGAFYGCYSLTELNIPNTVISLGDQIFARCKSLTKIVMPYRGYIHRFFEKGVVSEPFKNDFYNARRYEDYMIPKRLSEIYIIGNNSINADYAFGNLTSLSEIHVGENIPAINNTAFLNCNGIIAIDKEKDSISGSPWGAYNATITWRSEG